jgi:hypothetical protein
MAQSPALVDYGVCTYEAGQPVTQACLDKMTAAPKPALEPVPLDGTTLGSYSFWRVGPNAINTYDGPGGGVSGQIPQGFNLVNATDTSNPDWLQIQGGQWISRADARLIEASFFSGVLLPEGWDQSFAWVLDTTGIYASLRPGEEGSAESGYLTRRYDMVNIFAEAYDSEGWRWYMIGPNQWLKQTFVAKVQPAPHPPDMDGNPISGRWMAADLYEQTLIAYEDDKPVFATLISTGLDGTETEEGLYPIWARVATDPMSGSTGAPNAYSLQTVPWVMYFNESESLHGTYWHDFFGYRRSRGCVNLSISDARWVFDWTAQSQPNANGEVVNYVYVFSSGVYGVAPGKADEVG